MRDVSQRWAPPPHRIQPLVARDDLSVRWIHGLSQILISGDLQAARDVLRIAAPEVGLCGIGGPEALVRLARDRALLVSETRNPDVAPGWHPQGFAATPMSDAWLVLEVSGPQAPHLIAQAATVALSRANASPSAALLFAGSWAILYRRTEDTARLHIEQPVSTYVTTWIKGGQTESDHATIFNNPDASRRQLE